MRNAINIEIPKAYQIFFAIGLSRQLAAQLSAKELRVPGPFTLIKNFMEILLQAFLRLPVAVNAC